ncbi:MAG: thioredoxin fold domain-containing protein [Fimbriimonadaceae bacterium]
MARWRGVSAALLLAAAVAAQAQLRWGASLEAALQESRRTGRLVLALFVTEGCGWCQRMERETLADAKVAAELRGLTLVRLDASKTGAAAAKRYRVQGFPTLILLNSRGEAESTMLGFEPPAEFLETLRSAVADAKARPGLEARLAKDPKDVDALCRLAGAAARSGNLARARQMADATEAADPEDRFRRLAKTLCVVGDAFQAAMRYDDAIGFFQRALKRAKGTDEVAYARLSIAACRISKGEDEAAKREIQAALALPDLSERDRRAAESMLAGLVRRGR